MEKALPGVRFVGGPGIPLKGSQGEPGGARKSQEGPGWGQEEPGVASRSQVARRKPKEPEGEPGSSLAPPGFPNGRRGGRQVSREAFIEEP